MNPFQKLKQLAAEAAAREQSAQQRKPEIDNASLLDAMLDNHEKPKPTLAPPAPPAKPFSWVDAYQRDMSRAFLQERERERELARERDRYSAAAAARFAEAMRADYRARWVLCRACREKSCRYSRYVYD